MYRVTAKTENGALVPGETGYVRFAGLRLRTLILIGCLISIAAFLGVRNGTESQVRNDFQLSSETRVQAVQREIEDSLAVLRVVRAYFESPKDEGSEAFDRFSSQTISAYRSLQSLEVGAQAARSGPAGLRSADA